MSDPKKSKAKADRMKDYLEKKYAKIKQTNEKIQERKDDLEDQMSKLNLDEEQKAEARFKLAKVENLNWWKF